MRKRLLVAFILSAHCGSFPASAAEIEVVRNQVYAEAAGEQLLADVYRPAGEEPCPGVLVVHGGAWTIGNKAHLGFAAREFARSGFCAVAINYRLAPKHRFPAQLEDCLAAVDWMRANATKYAIDSQRIAGYGYSAGAHLVALMGAGAVPKPADEPAAKRRLPLQAIVAGGTPCDFRTMPTESRVLEYWLGGSRQEQPELYRLASPAHYVSALCAPVLFFHGEDDALAPLPTVKAMSGQLLRAGAISELYVVPGKGHVLSMFDDEALRRSIEFLKKHLASEEQSKD
jgi:triacylglycerol lipase